MNEKTNINDYSYEELIELEKRMKLKIEKYNVRLEAISKQKKIQKKKERLEAKEQAKQEKLKTSQSKLIDNAFDVELKNTQIINLEESAKAENVEKQKPAEVKTDEMYKVSVDRQSKHDKELKEAKKAKRTSALSFSKDKNIKVSTKLDKKDEPDKKDPKEKKSKTGLFVVLAVIVLLIGAGSVYGYTYYKDTYREIADFTKQDIVSLENWAAENEIEIVRSYEHSDIVPEYSVISQNISAGETINRKEVKLEVIVSLGPDLKKAISIDDGTFSGMTLEEINKWLEDNFVENFDFEYILDDDIESDYFISFRVEDLLTDESLAEFNRSQKFLFTISLGSSSDEVIDATIIDFSQMSKGEIELWLLKRRLVPKFVYDFSSTVEKNGVIEQDVAPNSTVASGTTITITLSWGSGVEVPNFASMSLSQISSFSKDNKVTVRQNLKYSNTVKKDAVINQSLKSGTRIKENSTVYIDVSLGKVDVVNFVTEGYNVDDIGNWISSVNSYGAGLSVQYVEDWDKAPKNKIVKQDITGPANNGTVITVTTSKGPAVDIPNFNSWTEAQVNEFENSNSITINIKQSYNYEDSGNVIDGTQSKVGKYPEGTSMDVTVSLGKVPIEDFSGKTKEYVQSYVDSLNGDGAKISLTIDYEPVVGGENNKYYSQSVGAGSYNPDFGITVYFEKTAVQVESFAGRPKSDIVAFCSANDLTCTYSYDGYSDTLSVDEIISNTTYDKLPWSSPEVIEVILSNGPEPEAFVKPYHELPAYSAESMSAAQRKSAVEGHLASQGFTSYSVVLMDAGMASGTFLTSQGGYSLDGYYKLSESITIYIQQ